MSDTKYRQRLDTDQTIFETVRTTTGMCPTQFGTKSSTDITNVRQGPSIAEKVLVPGLVLVLDLVWCGECGCVVVFVNGHVT